MPDTPAARPPLALDFVEDAPLFGAALLFASGIALNTWLWITPTLLFAASLAAILVSIWACVLAPRLHWLPISLLWILLGAFAAGLEPQPVPDAGLRTLSDGLMRSFHGRIVGLGPMVQAQPEPTLNTVEPNSEPTPAVTSREPWQRIDLDLSSIEVVDDNRDQLIPASGVVRLTVHWPSSAPKLNLHCGSMIEATAQIKPPQHYNGPGLWNHASYLLQQGVTSTATVSAQRIALLPDRSASSPQCFFEELRNRASESLVALPRAMQRYPAWLRLSPSDGILLSSLITGDRTMLAQSLRVGFERTGSFHMLVVSGLHLAILAAWLTWICRFFHLGRTAAVLVTLSICTFYAFFTGMNPPIARALCMVVIYMLGRLIWRTRSRLNTIGFAILTMLVVVPHLLFDASFEMTLLAVLSLGGIAYPLLELTVNPWIRAMQSLEFDVPNIRFSPRIQFFRASWQLSRERARAGRWHDRLRFTLRLKSAQYLMRFVQLILASTVAELALALPMAIYFHRITLYALPANFIVLPLLSLLVPLAMLTLLLGLISPALAAIPGLLTATVLHFGLAVVGGFGKLHGADWRIPAPHLWQILLYGLLLVLSILVIRTSRRVHRHWHAIPGFALLVAAAMVAVWPLPIAHPADAMIVEAIDVGQGDSILLITPDGKTLLIDGGGIGGGYNQRGQSESKNFDVGEEVVAPVLWARGIRHLDVVAISHAHSDHIGGLPAILRDFHPAELWVGHNPSSPEYDALLAEAASLNISLRRLSAGDQLPLGQAWVRVLSPQPDYSPAAEPGNNDSLVFRVEFQQASVLFEGDAESPVEESILAHGALPATLLKVGHHGSLTSSTPQFLAAVHPQWAVISAGRDNHYGHPRQQILERLESMGIRTLHTDLSGTLCFRLASARATPMPGCSQK